MSNQISYYLHCFVHVNITLYRIVNIFSNKLKLIFVQWSQVRYFILFNYFLTPISTDRVVLSITLHKILLDIVVIEL